MPRKRKSEQAIKDTETAATTATIEPEPDTSIEPHADMPVLPQAAAPVEHAPSEHAPSEHAPSEQAPSFVERLEKRTSRPVTPDPYMIALDNAAGVRLFENRQGRVMAIAFDERPAQPVIDRIKEEGYRWNPTDRVWTHTVQRDSAMGTRIDAERLYQEVRQMIRQDKGIDAGQNLPF